MADQSQDPGSTAGPVSNYFDDMDGDAVKDEQEEEQAVFSSDEEESKGFHDPPGRSLPS